VYCYSACATGFVARCDAWTQPKSVILTAQSGLFVTTDVDISFDGTIACAVVGGDVYARVQVVYLTSFITKGYSSINGNVTGSSVACLNAQNVSVIVGFASAAAKNISVGLCDLLFCAPGQYYQSPVPATVKTLMADPRVGNEVA